MTTLPTRARRAILMPTLARGLRYGDIKQETPLRGSDQSTNVSGWTTAGKTAKPYLAYGLFNFAYCLIIARLDDRRKICFSFVASLGKLTDCTQSNICAKITFTNRLGFDKMSGVNNPNKSEMPPVDSVVANLGNRTVGGCNAMTRLFYHACDYPNSEQPLKILAVGS